MADTSGGKYVALLAVGAWCCEEGVRSLVLSSLCWPRRWGEGSHLVSACNLGVYLIFLPCCQVLC